MPPISLGTSHLNLALETGQAKLWILLIGVNEYQDHNLPRLRYSAFDCQGLGESLNQATQAFPQKEIIIHHDFSPRKPILKTVKASLDQIVTSAKTQDTILFYFSGHGLIEYQSQQTVLCLADTQRDNLLHTGLTLQALLTMLGKCSAHSQVVWLDACHCGNMSLTGARGEVKKDVLDDSTAKLLETLRQRAAKSKGFYALLSCDQGQQSWEFPDLGHGVFSYFLMQGLRGEAANFQGVIQADGLYRYVYNQTLQYIEKVNQQLRLINQQKRYQGDPHLYSEYSLQTPKRIVEGVGELILGLKSSQSSSHDQRHALIVEGLSTNQTSIALSEVFQQEGHFCVTLISTVDKQESEVQKAIRSFLQPWSLAGRNRSKPDSSATLLLYLRGRIEDQAKGDSSIVLQNGIAISRSWLRQELRRSQLAQQIIILDGHGTGSIQEWIEELKLSSDHGQCLLGAMLSDEQPELLAQTLLESLIAANPQAGLSGAQWLSLLQTNCEHLGITFSGWLSGTQGVIDILPGKFAESLPTIPKVEKGTAKPSMAPLTKDSMDSPGSSNLSPEQYANLSQFLMKLIGPVALPLLQSASEQENSTQDLLENLAEYLSPEQKIIFDQWIALTIKEEKYLNTSLVRVAQIKDSQPRAKKTFDQQISPETYTQLELVLEEIIGPIAPILLEQMAEKCAQPELLITSLKEYLTPTQKTDFEKQIVSILTPNKQQEAVFGAIAQPSSEATPMSLDQTFIDQCEQELTKLIGPIAKFIIKTTLQDQPQISPSEFVERLATAIPNEEQAHNFLKSQS